MAVSVENVLQEFSGVFHVSFFSEQFLFAAADEKAI